MIEEDKSQSTVARTVTVVRKTGGWLWGHRDSIYTHTTCFAAGVVFLTGLALVTGNVRVIGLIHESPDK